MNNNQTKPCPLYVSDAAKIGLTIAYAFVLIAAIIGNSFVIHIVRTKKKMKVSFNFLVVNLAAADILNAISTVPVSIKVLHGGPKWFPGPFGIFLCKASNFLIVVPTLVSTTTLTVITIERYLATTKVLKRPLSTSAVKRVIGVVWFLTCVLSIHEIFKMDVLQMGPFYVCWTTAVWRNRIIPDMLIRVVVSYAFPLWTMIILYSMIICLLWKKRAIGEEIDEINRRLHKQKKGVIVKLVTIVMIFAICWLPVHVNHLMAAFNFQVFQCLPSWVPMLFYWLAHANCAINPFLYLMLTKNSRALFKAHLSGIIRGDGSSGKNSSRQGKDKHNKADSILFWKRGGSKKTTKTIII